MLTLPVLIVGYSDSDGSWLIQNSNGTAWGENGRARIPYTNDCGIRKKVTTLIITNFNDNLEVTVDVNSLMHSTESGGLEGWQIALIVVSVTSH